jgi:hypothetical protein
LSFLSTATLRLRHSWTRYRRSRLERRLAKEARRLDLLVEMSLEQRRLCARLEQRLHPPLEAVMAEIGLRPPEDPEPSSQPTALPMRPHGSPPWTDSPEQTEQPEPEEPMADPGLEIAQRLGLLQPQTSFPVSESSPPR